MAIALPTRATARRTIGVDLSVPVLVGLAALLCVLVILPVSWLVYYSLTVAHPPATARSFTLAHFQALIADPDLIDPLVTTVCRCATASGKRLVVVSTGRVPALPPLPVQRTCHVVVTVTVKNRSLLSGPVCGWSALLLR